MGTLVETVILPTTYDLQTSDNKQYEGKKMRRALQWLQLLTGESFQATAQAEGTKIDPDGLSE